MKYVAITACPAGIAHTYMAAEKLAEAGVAAGHEVNVETQGSIGVENELTPTQISEADAVIIAADKSIDLDRFDGKRVLVTGVAEAISHPAELLERSLHAPVHGQTPADIGAAPADPQVDEHVSGGGLAYRALMNGVSHMIPFVVTGGLLIAIALSVGGDPTPGGLKIPEGSIWNSVNAIGSLAFKLMVPVLSGYIAYAIADRPGLAPGMICGFIANDGSFYNSPTGAGFLGAILTGFAAGYVALGIKRIPVPKYVKPIWPIIVIPIITTLIVGMAFIGILGRPIAQIFAGLTNWLAGMQSTSAIILGLIIGLMVTFDMGGPVNKTACLLGGGLIATGNTHLMGMCAAAIPVPPLGTGLATLIGRRLFTSQERESGLAALVMGLFGITEGAIPFAAADPLRVIPANMLGGAVASGIAASFHVGDAVMHGGPIVAVLGAITNIVPYVVAMTIGTCITAFTTVLLKSISARKNPNRVAKTSAGTVVNPLEM